MKGGVKRKRVKLQTGGHFSLLKPREHSDVKTNCVCSKASVYSERSIYASTPTALIFNSPPLLCSMLFSSCLTALAATKEMEHIMI